MKTYFFLAGLPRSGSTVLASILNQNPDMYVSPTSGLLNLLMKVEAAWKTTAETKAGDCPPEQFMNVTRGFIDGYYKHIDKKIIFDKGRGWPANIPGIRQAFGIEPKILCTMRDIVDVIASFMSLMERDKRPLSYLDEDVFKLNLEINNVNRSRVLWEHYLKRGWQNLQVALQNAPDCLHIIEYEDLVTRPDEIIGGIYDFLEIESFEHKFQGIENKTPEKDEFWRLTDLHTIRPELKKTSRPASEVLGEEIYQQFAGIGLEFWRQ